MNTPASTGAFRIAFPLSESNQSLFLLLQLAHATAEELKKLGGKARCFMTLPAVVMEVSGVTREEIEQFTDALGSSRSMAGATLKVVLGERDAPEVDLDAEGVLPGEYVIAKLTKKFLFGLPDGAILVGNSFVDGRPTFAARMRSGIDRERIWRRAVNSGDAQRICSVYWDLGGALEIEGVAVDEL